MSIADKIYELAMELEKFSYEEDTECGEWWKSLAGLYPRVIDAGSDEFKKALVKEMEDTLRNIKENWAYVQVTAWQAVKTFKELRHSSEITDDMKVLPWDTTISGRAEGEGK